MPTLPSDFPFQFRVCRENEDIQLITTSDTQAINSLIGILDLENEITQEIKILLDASMAGKKHTVISLHNRPEEGANFAYAALLECDLCGVRRGYFALFKSLSNNTEALAQECKEMHDFFNSEMDRNSNFEMVSKRSRSAPG